VNVIITRLAHDARPRANQQYYSKLNTPSIGSVYVHVNTGVCSNNTNKMHRIKGNNDGPNGRNESYEYKGRTYPRLEMVRRVKNDLHPQNTTVRINGREYVKDKPDSSKSDNVNRKRL